MLYIALADDEVQQTNSFLSVVLQWKLGSLALSITKFSASFACHSEQISNLDYKSTLKEQNVSAAS